MIPKYPIEGITPLNPFSRGIVYFRKMIYKLLGVGMGMSV